MTRLPRAILSGLLIALSMGRPLGAQRPVAVEVGVASVRFPDDATSVIGPTVRLSASGVRRRTFGSIETAAVASSNAVSAFGAVGGGVRSAAQLGWGSELSGEASGVTSSASNRSAGSALVNARALWNTMRGGAWLRGGTSAKADNYATLGGIGVDGGGWFGTEQFNISASLATEWTRAELFANTERRGFLATVPVRYSEARVSLHAEDDQRAIDVSGGIRHDADAATTNAPYGTATYAYWFGSARALVLSASHQLADWVRGADAADVVSIGFRFQASPRIQRAERTIAVIQVIGEDSSRVVRVSARGAKSVEVMADFTDWQPVSLAQRGDRFERAFAMDAGSHRVVVRVDGGSWRPAANTPAVDDDLGGRAGLLLVP